METKKKYDVDEKGSLGLLALGDVGYILWKKAIKESKKQNKNKSSKVEKK